MDFSIYLGIAADIIVALILVFSFIGGLKQGAIKAFLGLLAFIIAIPLAGIFTPYISGWLSFVGDSDWRSLIALLLTVGIIIIVLHLVLWIPRTLLEKVWNSGFFWNLLGGLFGVMNSALGLVFMIKLLDIYPVLPWLDGFFAYSHVLNWLGSTIGANVSFLMQNIR